MKNFEKWEKEIKEIAKSNRSGVGLKNGIPISCKGINCGVCDFSQNGNCESDFIQWLYQEYKEKPKLNKYEHALCVALDEGWIARDKNGELFYYNSRPYKENCKWHVTIGNIFRRVSEMKTTWQFNFIQWEDSEPWSIEDLFELEVVE